MHNIRLLGIKVLLISTLFLSACAGATAVPVGTSAPSGTSTESATSAPLATDTSAVSGTTEVTGTVTSEVTGTVESGTAVVTGTETTTGTAVVTGTETTGTAVATGTETTTGTAVATETTTASGTAVVTGTTEATSAVGTSTPEATGTSAAVSTPEVTGTALITSTPGAASGDIIGVIMSSTNFSTIIQGLNATGLVTQLQQAGPFTVFAPNDQAFAKLSSSDLTSLMSDPQGLKNVLTYHVVEGRYTTADLAKMTSLKTVNGATLTITVQSGVVYVNGAQIVQGDIQAANGVVHVIDTVLTPPTP
jgi:transforming growth factor-beta-induced protein